MCQANELESMDHRQVTACLPKAAVNHLRCSGWARELAILTIEITVSSHITSAEADIFGPDDHDPWSIGIHHRKKLAVVACRQKPHSML